MRKWLVIILFFVAASVPGLQGAERWEGVDKAVIEKYAEQAGRPPQRTWLNAERGDLLLFFFLIAGAAGGFVLGYYFRELFPPSSKER